MPQGSILGPLPFILYANDLTQAIHQSKVIQYADDTTMSSVSNDISELKEGLVDELRGCGQMDRDKQIEVKWAEKAGVAFE